MCEHWIDAKILLNCATFREFVREFPNENTKRISLFFSDHNLFHFRRIRWEKRRGGDKFHIKKYILRFFLGIPSGRHVLIWRPIKTIKQSRSNSRIRIHSTVILECIWTPFTEGKRGHVTWNQSGLCIGWSRVNPQPITASLVSLVDDIPLI